MPRIANHKPLQSKSRTHDVRQVGLNTYRVISGYSGNVYTVRVQDQVKDGAVTYTGCVCDCPWGQYRPSRDGRSGCSHAMAVFDHLDKQRTVSAWSTVSDAKRQRRPIQVVGDGVILTSRKRTRLASAVGLYGDDTEI